MGTKLARGRPVTAAPGKPRFAPLAHPGLRADCEAAQVPLVDPDGWPLLDAEVVEAVAIARRYPSLERAALVLAAEARPPVGGLHLGSRAHLGPISLPEALVLASVLRSPAADGIA